MGRLTERVALVTGAANGIGRATAIRLADEGAYVLVTDVQDGSGVVDQIAKAGGTALWQPLNVTDEDQWAAAVARAVDTWGHLDILVNNAGVGDPTPIEGTTRQEYERVIAITQTSVLLGMQAAADALKSSPHASIINISSIFGASGGFGFSPAYHAAKGAVRLMTKNVAIAWAKDGVRVNSIHPGVVRTALLDALPPTDTEVELLRMTPLGRLGRPEEIAAGVAYLASDDASFVTGSELYIDGGYMAV